MGAGMESAPSEDNLDSKGAGSASSPALAVLANSSRAYSSDDLGSMGGIMAGPSGKPPPHSLPVLEVVCYGIRL